MAKNKPGGGFGSPASTPPRMPTIRSGGGNNNNNNRKKNRNNNNNNNGGGGNRKKRRRNNGGGDGIPGPNSKNNPYGSQYANPDVHAFASWLVHNFYNSSPDIQGLDLQNDGQGPMRYSVF